MALDGIQQKKTHFRQMLGLKYEQEASAEGFYNLYRNLVIASLKKKGDIIMWQNNKVLTEDEQLSPTFEEMILTAVLRLIDTCLPEHIMDHYDDTLGSTKSMMDYKSDILARVPVFLKEIEDSTAASAVNADGADR
jgi:hypothetical protein